MYKIYTKPGGMAQGYIHKLLLIMKLTTFILMIALAQVSAAGFAQKLTYSKQGASLHEIFKQIKSQTGYNVLYSPDQIDASKKVNINFKQADLQMVMQRLINSDTQEYSIMDKNILIKEKAPSLFDRARIVIQSAAKDLWQDVVRGVVKDNEGKPLPNASIRVKGKSAVTNTNQNGEFEIKGVDEDAVLLVSYVGFKTLEISLKDAVMPLEVMLNVATGELEEVKVTYSTGYQELNKERSTGSFVQLDNKLLNRTPSTNILDRIINVTSSMKRERGGTSDISIRGYSTINANMKPLIVVDGFAYDEGSDVQQMSIKNLNPNDVESVTILRDAAAASIWGARAGNGVIVINTKKGTFNKKTTIQFNANVNLIEKPNLKAIKIINSRDAIEYERLLFEQGLFNDYDDVFPSFGLFTSISPAMEIFLAKRRGELSNEEAEAKLDELGEHDVRDDIEKYFLRNGVNQQYNLNISGGAEKNSYYLSFGHDNNMSSSIGSGDKRYSLRFDNTFRPIKQLEINTFLSYIQSNSKTSNSGYNGLIANGSNGYAAPYTRLVDAKGNPLHVPSQYSLRIPYIDTVSAPGVQDWQYKPIDELKNNTNTNKFNTARLGGFLKYTVISGLSVEVRGQYEKSNGFTEDNYNKDSYNTRNLINQFVYQGPSGNIVYPVPVGDILYQNNSTQTVWNMRGQLNFNKSWEEHQLTALIAYEASETNALSSRNQVYGYDPEMLTSTTKMDFQTIFASRPFGVSQISNDNLISGRLNRFNSYLGNAAYTFRNRYTATVSGRVDKSNFLGAKANQRMVPLGSAGLSWNMSNEDFYKISWMPSLRFRATYGYNGNLNNKATALTVVRVGDLGSSYQSLPYFSLASPPNPGLTWEKIKVVNLGIDYGLLDGRIAGSLDFYSKKGINLIGPVRSDATVGTKTYTGNYASMKGKGVDLMLNSININSNIRWTTNLTLSCNSDEVTDYNDSQNRSAVRGVGLVPIVGKPLSNVYSIPYAGLDPSNGDPRGFLKGQIVDYNTFMNEAKFEDMVYHGTATPKVFGSVLNEVSYKGVALSFNIIYKFNYYFQRRSISYYYLYNSWGGHSDYALRWKNPGDEIRTNVPSVSTTNDAQRENFYSNSSVLIEKADHIRLQDVRLSYDLNKSAIRKSPFTNASIFLYVGDIGIIWRKNKQGLDPEASGNSAPISKTASLGVNLNF